MLFLIFFLTFTRIICTWSFNGGSTLFYNRFVHPQCWDESSIAKLRARRLFEQIVPSSITPERVNTKYIRDILHYYRRALRSVDKGHDMRTSLILKDALADTIGGHLKNEVLPTARFAYYAGYVPYVKVRDLHDFYDKIREILNTQGIGWRSPRKIPEWSNLTVAKILIGDGKYFNPCGSLVIKRDSSSCMRLSSPLLDDEHEPSAIALPLKTGGLISLTSPSSENILLKYYTTVSRCILKNSPARCRHTDFVNFNNDMWHWMKRHVAPHLVDEKVYTAYGGVLRIAAAVQSYGKGLSRRNLYEMQNTEVLKWHPWRTLMDTHVYVNADWTPQLYVGVVIFAVISIFLIQMCYNYILGDDGCTCAERLKREPATEVEYAHIETNIPAMLPLHQSAVFYSEQKRTKGLLSKTKASSLGSFQTQKVYDLNENTEKLMSVIMSKENSSNETESNGKDDEMIASDTVTSERSLSPPKIETDVSQLKLPRTNKRLQLYSTSTVSQSELTYQQRATDSNWSGSSSSEQSDSSTSSKPTCRQSRSSRDLSWARRVASKQNSRTRSTSATELDYTSFMTPPSKR